MNYKQRDELNAWASTIGLHTGAALGFGSYATVYATNRLAAFWARMYPEKYPLKDIPPTYPRGK